MKLLLMTGSHPRHNFIARTLNDNNLLHGLIIEQREEHEPSPPKNIDIELQKLFKLHFEKRKISEMKFFGTQIDIDVPTITVSKENLNSDLTKSFIQEIQPTILLSYGVHKLENSLLKVINGYTWNIHGGLSPWYRGNITHFWPSYQMEPQNTGMTIHELTQDIDGGRIIHQTAAEMVKGDGIHDTACRAVLSLEEDLPKLINKIKMNEEIHYYPQRTTGKIWISKDWRPDHLRIIYQLYNDNIVDHYLNKKIANVLPKLINQFGG